MEAEDDKYLKDVVAKWASDETALTAKSPYELLHARILEQVKHWLDNDYEKLAQVCYLLDVHEERLGEVMRSAPFDEIPDRVTRLIIEREVQKAKIRASYNPDK